MKNYPSDAVCNACLSCQCTDPECCNTCPLFSMCLYIYTGDEEYLNRKENDGNVEEDHREGEAQAPP